MRRRAKRLKGSKSKSENASDYAAGDANTLTTLGRKTLWISDIAFCNPPATGANLGSVRTANTANVFVKGIKLCSTFFNRSNYPIRVHFAIVQMKGMNQGALDVGPDMFSCSQIGQEDQYVNFVNVTTNAQWDKDQDCYNLNPNKFNILFHRRFDLNGLAANDFRREGGATWKTMDEYIKIGKTFSYDSINFTQVEHPLFVLVWHETIYPSDAVGTENIQMNIRHHTYFKNI